MKWDLMQKVLIATQKPFDSSVRDQMVKIIEQGGLEVAVLENYKGKQELKDAVGDINYLIVRSDEVDEEIIDIASNLELVVRGGADYHKTIKTSYAELNGVIVENTPGMNANSVAEEAVGIMFALARNLHIGDQTMKAGQFLASELMGFELEGKKVGVHAFGNVGKLFAKKASSLGMLVSAYDTDFIDESIAAEYGATLETDPKEIYRNAHIVSLHFPETEDTVGIVNYDLLSLMNKENAILINTARPGIIDYESLKRMFEERKGFKYGSDVNAVGDIKKYGLEKFSDRILLLPKLGAQTPEANSNVGIAAAEQCVAFSKGVIYNNVNNPLPREMKDYAMLAQALGKFNTAFVRLPTKVELTCYGGKLSKYQDHFGQYVLKGLFEDSLKTLTPTEALDAAKQRGIDLVPRNPDPRKSDGVYFNVTYRTSSGEQHSIDGRIDGSELQITRVGEFRQIIPITSFEYVLVEYAEQAGMADRIGDVISQNGRYNKANGGFRRNDSGDRAMFFAQVEPVGTVVKEVKAVVEDIKKLPGVLNSYYIDMRN